MASIRYRPYSFKSKPLVWALVSAFTMVSIGLGAAWYIEHHGHVVTGMDNQVVWGIPHVFAVFLIIAASGALNVASMGSVFGQTVYKPLGRLSGLVAFALLVGGLAVLVLDLGRPDQLIVAMTIYNFKSIFAWNIFLYTQCYPTMVWGPRFLLLLLDFFYPYLIFCCILMLRKILIKPIRVLPHLDKSDLLKHCLYLVK